MNQNAAAPMTARITTIIPTLRGIGVLFRVGQTIRFRFGLIYSSAGREQS
jgi:hypothetical protein